MEEKATAKTRLNDIMSRKVNMDFLKNINLPPIKIPKIKSRKIFNAKTPAKSDTFVPPPERTCVDRSPSRISTISSLVNNDPEPDYNSSFGRLSIAQSAVDLRPEKDRNIRSRTKDDPSNKPLSFSEKLSRQYKDFSEFKFRHILGKKTIVRTTTIDISNYSHQSEDLISERSDYDFEFHSLPPSKFGRREELTDNDDNESAKGSHCKSSSRQASINSNEGSSLPRRTDSCLQMEGGAEPHKSSLFKQMKSMSIKRMTGSGPKQSIDPMKDEKLAEDDLKNSRKGGISKMSFNRQTIEDACCKARSSVSNQLQKLKNIQTRRQHGEPTTPGEGKYTKKTNPEVIFPNITYNTETDGVVRSLSPIGTSSRPSSREWRHRSRRQDSLGTFNGFPRRFLQPQSSTENSEEASPPRKFAFSPQTFEDNQDEQDGSSSIISHLAEKHQSTKRTRPIHVPIPKSPLDSTYNSWETFKLVNPPKQHSIDTGSNSSSKISRPAPPLPPGKPDLNTPLELLTKTEMIRRRFCQKLDDSIDNNMNSSMDSQDSDSWIPEVFKGPSPSQIILKPTEENGTAWSKMTSKKPVLQKSLSIDIFDSNVEEPFNDFDEALENVPTVEVNAACSVLSLPGQIVNRNVHARVTPKLSVHTQENQEVTQITRAKSEMVTQDGISEPKRQKFSKILSRFENNTGRDIQNETINFMQELASTYEITSVIQNSEFRKPTIKITDESPKSINQTSLNLYRSFPLPPPPPPPQQVIIKPQAPVNMESTVKKSLSNQLAELSSQVEAAKEFQQTIIDQGSKQELEICQATNEGRPFLKKFLHNEVTHSTLCDELDEDIFHSLDYEDAAQNDAKPLTHRKSIRVVYTAEV